MALILSRRVGETIRIKCGSDHIDITVMEIRAGQVKIATTAPSHVDVDRMEIYTAKLKTPYIDSDGNK